MVLKSEYAGQGFYPEEDITSSVQAIESCFSHVSQPTEAHGLKFSQNLGKRLGDVKGKLRFGEAEERRRYPFPSAKIEAPPLLRRKIALGRFRSDGYLKPKRLSRIAELEETTSRILHQRLPLSRPCRFLLGLHYQCRESGIAHRSTAQVRMLFVYLCLLFQSVYGSTIR